VRVASLRYLDSFVKTMTLLDVIKKAEKDRPGSVCSVIPMIRERKAIFAVQIAAGGKRVEVCYDALTGAKK
jgi:uncharacterized membrane protein YkoI